MPFENCCLATFKTRPPFPSLNYNVTEVFFIGKVACGLTNPLYFYSILYLSVILILLLYNTVN